MARIELGALILLAAALLGTAALLLDAPAWPVPAALMSVLGISLALLARDRQVGFSVGQVGLFLLFLIGIGYAIGDFEVPVYVEPIISPYAKVVLVSLLYFSCATVLRRAQAAMRLRVGQRV